MHPVNDADKTTLVTSKSANRFISPFFVLRFNTHDVCFLPQDCTPPWLNFNASQIPEVDSRALDPLSFTPAKQSDGSLWLGCVPWSCRCKFVFQARQHVHRVNVFAASFRIRERKHPAG